MDKTQQFNEIAESLCYLYAAKNKAYGDSFGSTFEKLGIISAVTRISDKCNRLCNLAVNPDIDNLGESIEDTLKDLASYCVMTLIEINAKKMELNEYQKKAMSTCMDSCNNIAYILTGLTAEVGEVNDKIAKAIRKGNLSLHRNNIAWWAKEYAQEIIKDDLKKELGYTLEEIANVNLAKLADRAKRNVIDGNGDNR